MAPGAASEQDPSGSGVRDHLAAAGGSGSGCGGRGLGADPSGFPATPLSTPRSSVSTVSAAAPEPRRIDRSVESRTQFQITLPLSSAGSAIASPSSSTNAGDAAEAAAGDQRGWSSPHGEPYRPLGRPDLSLKFSPRLANGANLLQNAHRMKAFEGKDASRSRDQKAATATTATAVAIGGEMIRPAQPAALCTSSTASVPQLFDMFPLHFAPKKRPLDERQVKLAHRLHASMSHFSPGKVRGLRRAYPSPLTERAACGGDAESDSSRSLHGADASSVELLRRAVHECSSRLRAVKNGAGFLSQVPSGEHADLLALEEAYHRDRARFAASRGGVGVARVGGARAGLKTLDHRVVPHSDADARNFFSDSAEPEPFRSARAAEDDDVYLPYTTRRAQQSPTSRHPTLLELKATLRDEKLLRPLLSAQAAAGANGSGGAEPAGLSSSLSRQSIRSSRVGGSVLVSSTHQRPTETATPQSAFGMSTSPAPGRRASVVAVALQADDAAPPQPPSTQSDVTAVTLRALPHKTNANPAPQQHHHAKPHSVERLQAAVDAIEGAKAAHAQQLARAVASLRQDRRECLAAKFQHLSVQRHVDDDLHAMRRASERQRVEGIAESVERSAWYRDLLALLVARNAALHPAEALLVRAVRRTTHAGRAFDQPLLFRLVLLLHRDDLGVPEVQHALAFLRHALRVSLDDWGAFCDAHALPAPAEFAGGLKDPPPPPSPLENAHVHARFAKLRVGVTLNQAVRHFSRSGGDGDEHANAKT
ncbi:hypothetical protein PybrP1_003776 [[Pythium] brassicae (nom. inval.)]|nr:hypothetical protein PybrP1_003776 [[Pythium] brassicae (nom. inval.)]